MWSHLEPLMHLEDQIGARRAVFPQPTTRDAGAGSDNTKIQGGVTGAWSAVTIRNAHLQTINHSPATKRELRIRGKGIASLQPRLKKVTDHLLKLSQEEILSLYSKNKDYSPDFKGFGDELLAFIPKDRRDYLVVGEAFDGIGRLSQAFHELTSDYDKPRVLVMHFNLGKLIKEGVNELLLLSKIAESFEDRDAAAILAEKIIDSMKTILGLEKPIEASTTQSKQYNWAERIVDDMIGPFFKKY